MDAVRDFERFLNSSLNNDISDDIDAIIRASTARNGNCAGAAAGGKSRFFQPPVFAAPATADWDRDRDRDRDRLSFGSEAPSLFRDPLPDSSAEKISALSEKLAAMQLQIDNLVQHANPQSRISSTRSRHDSAAENTKLVALTNEVKELRELVSQQAGKPQNQQISSQLKSFVRKEIKKNNDSIALSIVRPEIERHFDLMESNLTLKIKKLIPDQPGNLRTNASAASDYGDLTPSLRWEEAEEKLTVKREPSKIKTYSPAEAELHDLMNRLSADLDRKRQAALGPNFKVVDKKTPSKPSSSYGRPTISSKMKAKSTAWK
ncbi:hypothetical protein HDU83_007745 [Entophlyctis luteolus]|nr:hypothetical protein HDU83_007745 [Entophlyctis luteolus]KAJ3383714.1 hypothetical protein HDU84_003425 [Entophlyctis sp. JEL0112]